MTTPIIDEEVREVRALLPSRDFTKPGPCSMPLDEAMNKIAVEYSDALELLGKI